MFERNYYYLVAGLPDILQDQKKMPFTISEFREELAYHLHKEDFELVKLLFLHYDNTNLLNLLEKNKKTFIELGNFSQDHLEEEIREPATLPEYMQEFIHAFKNETPLFQSWSWENQLTWLYYKFLNTTGNEFLRNWFEFDLNVKNIFSAFNVRKYKLAREGVFIGDNDITEALKRSTLKDFGLSNDFPLMEKLMAFDEDLNSMEKERSLDMLRWDYLNELNTFHYFTIEVLLAFTIKLFMTERWLMLDPETGKKMFKQIISELETSYEFPKEFRINEVRK